MFINDVLGKKCVMLEKAETAAKSSKSIINAQDLLTILVSFSLADVFYKTIKILSYIEEHAERHFQGRGYKLDILRLKSNMNCSR